MSKQEYCPNCGIGLNNREVSLCFCQNCHHSWGKLETLNLKQP